MSETIGGCQSWVFISSSKLVYCLVHLLFLFPLIFPAPLEIKSCMRHWLGHTAFCVISFSSSFFFCAHFPICGSCSSTSTKREEDNALCAVPTPVPFHSHSVTDLWSRNGLGSGHNPRTAFFLLRAYLLVLFINHVFQSGNSATLSC